MSGVFDDSSIVFDDAMATFEGFPTPTIPPVNSTQTLTQHNLLNYYANLLIIQYNSLPKATQTIKCLTNVAVCDQFLIQLQTCFNLNIAVGNQLTILGKIVGAPRYIYGLDLSHSFFNFTRYSGVPTSNGFNRYTTPTDSQLISRWATTTTYTSTDPELLALIKLRIIYNNYYESLGTIKTALWNQFKGAIDVVDNFNSTITYNFSNPYHNVASICSYLGNIVPKPMGIGITYTQV